MSDDADRSQETQELEDMIRKRYIKIPELEVQPIGTCLNCSTKLEGDKRWCDADCQQDWEKRQRR